MRMKKFLVMMIFMVTMLVSVSCYAQISEADMNIGGIYYGQSMEDVIKMFGQPIRKEPCPPHGSADVFKHNGSEISVRFAWRTQSERYVSSVNLKSGSGFLTASGIGIGSTYNDVIKAYGKADLDTSIQNPNAVMHNLKYKIPKGNMDIVLSFVLNNDKRVNSISFFEFEQEG